MIHFTTLIFTLLLSHIARAMPACGDVAPLQVMYDAYDYELVPASVQETHKVIYSKAYDVWSGETKAYACPRLGTQFRYFGNFPSFPYIGGTSNTSNNSPVECGRCWKLTNKKKNKSILITAMDHSGTKGFNIGEAAFRELNGGTVVPGSLDAEVTPYSPGPCPKRT